MTAVYALILLFLLHTSEDYRWGGGYWEHWLADKMSISLQSAHEAVFWIRKSCHFIGYGLLGLYSWYYFHDMRLKAASWLGLAMAGLTACLDEYTQSRTTFRSGQPTDVLLDLMGIIFFFALAKVMLRHRKI